MKSLKELRSQINEVLKSSDPIEKWIDDFVHSKNPKFASKTKAERIDMAKGAYYGAQKNESAAVSQNSTAEVSMNEDHLVHVNDGSKYDEEPHEKDVEHIMAGVKHHGGEHAGASDKGVFFKFKSKENAHAFKSHVNKCPNRSCDAEHVTESVLSSLAMKDLDSQNDYTAHVTFKDGTKKKFNVTAHNPKVASNKMHNQLKDVHHVDIKEAVEYKGIGTDVVDKKKKLNPQPNFTTDKKTVKDFKEEALDEAGKVYDPITKKMVARKPIKVQAGGGATRNGVPVETGPSKHKQSLAKEEVEQIDEISKETLKSYIPKAAKSSRIHGMISTDYKNRSDRVRKPGLKKALANLSDKYKSKAWSREDGIKRAVDKLTKEETITELSKKTLANYVNKASHDAASGAYAGKDYVAQSQQHTAAGDWDASKKKHDQANKEFARANKRLVNIPKATTKMAKEEVELDEAIAKKLPVQHAVDAVTKTFNTKTATRFLSHLKPGTDKHTTWDKVNAALVKQGVQTHHIASIAQKTSHMNEETIEEAAHVYDTKTGKVHSTHDTYKKAVNAMNKLNKEHPGYDTPGGLEQGKFGAKLVKESRGHKVLATFFKNREVAQRAFNKTPDTDADKAKKDLDLKLSKWKNQQRAAQSEEVTPKYLEKGIETPEKDAVEKKRMLGMKEAFLSKSEEDDMRNLDAYSFYKKYGRNKAKHRASRVTRASDVEKYTEETVVEGFDDYHAIAKELVKRHGKNVDTGHISDIEGERDSHRPLDRAEVMHHVNKVLGSKQVKEAEVHDDTWKEYKPNKQSIVKALKKIKGAK